jgi:hypothetical protein
MTHLVSAMCVFNLAVWGVGPHSVLPGSEVVVPLGNIVPGVIREVSLVVVSGMLEVWRVPKVAVSCSACVEVLESPDVLRFDEPETVRLQVTPSASAGPSRWAASLHGGGFAPLRIACEGTVVGLEAEPNELDFGRCPVGVTKPQTLSLQWHGVGRIVSVRCTCSDSAVEVRSVLASGTENATCTVKLLANQPRSFDTSIAIAVTVDDGVTRSREYVSIPLRAELFDPTVTVRPLSVFLGRVSFNTKAVSSVYVALNTSREMTATTNLAGLQVKMIAEGNELRCDMCYTPPSGLHGLQRGLIQLVDEPSGHVVADVPVLVFLGDDI